MTRYPLSTMAVASRPAYIPAIPILHLQSRAAATFACDCGRPEAGEWAFEQVTALDPDHGDAPWWIEGDIYPGARLCECARIIVYCPREYGVGKVLVETSTTGPQSGREIGGYESKVVVTALSPEAPFRTPKAAAAWLATLPVYTPDPLLVAALSRADRARVGVREMAIERVTPSALTALEAFIAERDRPAGALAETSKSRW